MFNSITDEMYNELPNQEIEKLKDVEQFIDSNQLIPLSILKGFSDIAFYMATESLETGKIYQIAPILNKIARNLYHSDRVSLYDKNQFRQEFGEMTLDFRYANGHRNISSLRLAPYIKARH